jgi:hypothetical protein
LSQSLWLACGMVKPTPLWRFWKCRISENMLHGERAKSGFSHGGRRAAAGKRKSVHGLSK